MSVPANVSDLEVNEQYPAAVEALERCIAGHPDEPEVVIRLGFNLWYMVVESLTLGWSCQLPLDPYARRFMALYREYRGILRNNADFCWAFGLGMHMFWYYFPGATEGEGKGLLARAGKLDPFYARMKRGEASQEEVAARFRDRGVFSLYYAVR